MTDLLISAYQWICFPVYQITLVKRADYVVFDRGQLLYLNFIERFHCAYCEYANGVIAYVREIITRTEQYFCSIKYGRRVLDAHARYRWFLDYGEPEHYAAKLEQYRSALSHANNQGKPDE